MLWTIAVILIVLWALGLVSLAGIPGQVGLGHLSDRVGREWVWTLGSLGFVLCYALLLAMRSTPTPLLLYAMVAAQGVLGYGLTSVFGAIRAVATTFWWSSDSRIVSRVPISTPL